MLGTQWFERHAKLFGWMAERHEVDWSRASGLAEAMAVRHAVNTCLSCTDVEACEAARQGVAGAPDDTGFCPNRSLFERWSGRTQPE